MKTTVCKYFILVFLAIFIVIIFPFFPGRYDPVAESFSLFFQIYSNLALLTIIPASLWLLRNIKYPSDVVPRDKYLLKRRIFFKIYYWMTIGILLIDILFTIFFMSFTFGIVILITFLYFSHKAWRKMSDASSHNLLFSKCLPASLALLPALLVVSQLALSGPLKNQSRARAINNSLVMISEIEKFRDRTGNYPLTLNAATKDYLTGVVGIEQYYYSYDSNSYNLYFKQPRFIIDRPGTNEFIVYNPHDRHKIMSHAAWHMTLEPGQIRNGQGWYESAETGHTHWKSFMFD